MNTFRGESVDEVFRGVAREFLAVLGTSNEVLLNHEHPFYGTTIRVTTEPTSPDHDKPMLEMEVHLTIRNPRHRLIYSKPVDIFNMVGQWIYLLSGSESVHPIAFYNPIGRRFADEGSDPVRLRATWGSRLFGSGAVDRVVQLLRTSPQTRRAVLPVLRDEDIGYPSRNLPCLAAVQFAVRNEKLDCFATMRSQAAIGVMPYDLFILTMMHEYVAMRTDLPLGVYHHYAPLCGIRSNEIPIIREMGSVAWSTEPMLPMEKLESGKLALFHMAERSIRKKGIFPMEAREQLPGYWKSLLEVTQAKWLMSGPQGGWRLPLQLAQGAFPEGWLRMAADWATPRWAVPK